MLKQERMIPVQSRVDINSLADMAVYLEKSGVDIKNMSMLISYCVDLAREVVFSNGMLDVVHETVSQSHETMRKKCLYQQSMMKRGGMKKLANALRLENMRIEGIDPKEYAPVQHKLVHNKHSVTPPDIGVTSKSYVSDEAFERERKKWEEEKKAEEEAKHKAVLDRINSDDSGLIVHSAGDRKLSESQIDKIRRDRERKDREQLEKMNECNFVPSDLIVSD
jgi:uncharacterized Fe-S cluster-containing protein